MHPHKMICIISRRNTGEIVGVTEDKLIANSRLEYLNRDSELSGDWYKPYVLNTVPIVSTESELNNYGEIVRDIEKVNKVVSAIDELSPELQQQVIEKYDN